MGSELDPNPPEARNLFESVPGLLATFAFAKKVKAHKADAFEARPAKAGPLAAPSGKAPEKPPPADMLRLLHRRGVGTRPVLTAGTVKFFDMLAKKNVDWEYRRPGQGYWSD